MTTVRRKGDRQRVAIVDAVRRLLTEVPFAELSIGRITDSANITRSGFYFYFDSKYDVLAAAFGDLWAEMQATMHQFELRAAAETPGEYSRRTLALATGVWRNNAPLINALMIARESDAQLRRMWDDWFDQLTDRVVAVVDHERGTGAATPSHSDTSELVRRLIGLTVWALHEDDLRADADPIRTLDVLNAIWLAAAWGRPAQGGTRS
jgi:AcrR family transcriptional regulator